MDNRDYKSEIINSLNKEAFFKEHLHIKGRSSNGKELVALCPFHEDKVASLSANIESGLWFCHACGERGDIWHFYQKIRNVDFKTAFEDLARKTNIQLPEYKSKKKIIPHEIADNFHKLLMQSVHLQELMDERGLTKETIVKYKIGWEAKTSRFIIPIYDEKGDLVNLRRYRMNAKQNKMISYVDERGERYGDARLFNINEIKKNKTLLFAEGEMDCILADQHGITAFTCTSGAGTFLMAWLKWFQGKVIYICFDNDLGGYNGARKVAQTLLGVCEKVFIIDLPSIVGNKGDITDYFAKLGHTSKDFKELVKNAKQFKIEKEEVKEETKNVSLAESSLAVHCGSRVSVKVMVSGKDTAPYIIPGEFRVWCDQGGGRMCKNCGLHSGERKLKLSAKNPAILELIGVTKETQTIAIKKMLGIGRCIRANIETDKEINIEEVRFIPQITFSTEENEYVTRMAYYIGHGLKSNRNYRIEGYVWPEPKKEYATLIFSELEEAQDNIESFEITPQIKEELKIFQQGEKTISEKLKEIHEDLEANVTRIWKRGEFMIAVDLLYHSVLSFKFQNELVPKGWITALVLGDSGQGKSCLINRIINHYCLGERIIGENATEAGLIGALSQVQGRWMLMWGKIPLNDRRLLVVDEFAGLNKEMISKFSDLLSTGVASITKVVTEQTNARTRLLLMSNPREGRQLNTYGEGVIAIKSLMAKNEDIRRLDFAITVASDEMDTDKINRLANEIPIVEHRYTSQKCRWNVLWAWSRKPEQIIFAPEAEREIIIITRKLAAKYSSQIPLIERADQRFKVARLAVALAARLHSTDDGETLLIKKEHILYIGAWLNKIYSVPSMAYDVFSRRMKESTEITDKRKLQLIIQFRETIPDSLELAKTLASNQTFKKQDITDQMKYDKDQIGDLWQFLSRNKLIKNIGTRGYVKESNLINMLRTIIGSDADDDDSNDNNW